MREVELRKGFKDAKFLRSFSEPMELFGNKAIANLFLRSTGRHCVCFAVYFVLAHNVLGRERGGLFFKLLTGQAPQHKVEYIALVRESCDRKRGGNIVS